MATRGQKPKPTNLRVITGNAGHRPLPKNEPKPPPVEYAPEPPGHLSAEARDEWMRVIPTLMAQRLLTLLDFGALAAYCQAYGRWVQAERAVARMAARDELTHALMIKTTSNNAIQNPLVGTANRAMELMLKAATEFGMTPSARSRVDAGAGGGTGQAPVGNAFARNGRRPGA